MENYQLAELQVNDLQFLNSIKPDNWTSITEIHEHYLITKNCGCIKVLKNNQIIGIGTGISFNKTGWLAHIIVSKENQNQGIGSSIVRDRIDYLMNKCGCQVITLTATDQGYPVYRKIGFLDESMYRIMEKSEAIKTNSQKSINIMRIESRHHKDIIKIDKIVSGEDRFELIVPVLNNGYVYEKNGDVLGFYLPKFGDSGVSAICEEAGLALLGERIKEDKRILIPEENHIAYQYLLDQGYKEIKKIYRMILGKSFERNPQLCYSRMGGFAG